MQHVKRISHATPAQAHFVHVIGPYDFDRPSGGGFAGKMAYMMAPFFFAQGKDTDSGS